MHGGNDRSLVLAFYDDVITESNKKMSEGRAVLSRAARPPSIAGTAHRIGARYGVCQAT